MLKICAVFFFFIFCLILNIVGILWRSNLLFTNAQNVATHNLPGLEDVLNAANGIHLKNAF